MLARAAGVSGLRRSLVSIRIQGFRVLIKLFVKRDKLIG